MVSFLSSNMLDKGLLPHAKYEELCDGVSLTPACCCCGWVAQYHKVWVWKAQSSYVAAHAPAMHKPVRPGSAAQRLTAQ